jgi:hypothetical protein
MSLEMDPLAESAEQAVAPVIKEVTVALDRERAFMLFTQRVAEWWPLATHSVEGEAAVACVLEERVGGRFYEVGPDGREHTWGTLLEWDPPAGFSMTWHAGRDGSTAQRLEVAFESTERGTLVRLVHTGWERLADGGREERDDYDSGWDYVLGFFSRASRDS